MDVSCAPNFIGDPTPTVTACDKPLTPYTVSGCRPMKCTSPTAEAKKDYVIKETSLEKPSFAVSATCLKGGMAGEAVPCIFDGEPYTLKGCDEASCESPRRTEETGYSVSLSCHQIAMSVRIRFAFSWGFLRFEDDRHFRSFKVSASCATGYLGKAEVHRCRQAGEPFTLSGCEPKTCTKPVGDEISDYEITPHSVEIPTFNVGVRHCFLYALRSLALGLMTACVLCVWLFQ